MLDDLRASVGRVSLEVQALADQVQALVQAVEALAPQPAATGPVVPVKAPAGGETAVRVSPLPELAMAAVAETAIRGLPAVNRMVSIERSGDQATFVVEVETGRDLVSEMRKAMPVPVRVDRDPDGLLTVVLEWGWGRPETSVG